jgi:hypothetical protein
MSMDEVYALVAAAGLHHNGFTSFQPSMDGREALDPARSLGPGPLLDRVARRTERERHAIAELLYPRADTLAFYASFRERSGPDPDDLDLVPEVSGLALAGHAMFEVFDAPTIAGLMTANPGEPVLVTHPTGRTTLLANEPATPSLVAQIGSGRSLGAMLERSCAETGRSTAEVREALGRLLASLAEIDWVLLRHVDFPPYEGYAELQRRVATRARASRSA